MRRTSTSVMIIFPKVLFRKLLDHGYVQVSSQQLRGTLKDTLWLKVLWTWIKIRANSFIKTLVNNMKRKSTKVPWTSLTRKNATPHFKEHCTKIDISLVVIRFFFSQTNLVFKSNPLFIDILDSLCHSLFTFLPLFCKFSPPRRLYAFFIKTSKVLIRFNVLFVRFSSWKCGYVLFSMKNSYLWNRTAVNGKNNSWH